MSITQRIAQWWQQFRCSHWQTAVHTFIENDTAPLVRRQSVCLSCGKKIGDLPPMDDRVLMSLLDQAAKLPSGTSVKL